MRYSMLYCTGLKVVTPVGLAKMIKFEKVKGFIMADGRRKFLPWFGFCCGIRDRLPFLLMLFRFVTVSEAVV